MNISNKTAGFGTVGVVIDAIIMLVAAGVVAWRVWDTNQAKNSAPANATTDSAQSTIIPMPTDPNEGYIVIKEWGVRFKPVEGLNGLIYFKPRIVTSDAYSFTTSEMNKKEPRCSTSTDMMPFGLLQRNKTTDPTAGGEVATIDGYVYRYRGTDAACSEDSANLNQEVKIVGQIIQSVKSLEDAK